MLVSRLVVFTGILSCLLAGCQERALNDPYPNEATDANTLYTSFTERPKHLDPAQSYSSNEWVITNQVYEPPLQYHYLKRPYTLEPLIATSMPTITYMDKAGHEHQSLASSEIAYTLYTIHIKPHIMFQPHPAFAKNAQGEYRYHVLTEDELDEVETLSDFKASDTRELTADDFVYQIKRLADPTLNSPIFGLMQGYIVGLDELEKTLKVQYDKLGATFENPEFLDLRQYPLEGAKVLDRYTYQIKIIGEYPQFIYWLALPFFAPMPWEAAKFLTQDGLVDKNITLDWYPIGTGPYMLRENNPNQRMLLIKNPNYHGEHYPSEGTEEDKSLGLLTLAGKSLPFLDKVMFTLEKESIPYWNKFLEGYYDESGISSDSFDQALQSNPEGGLELSESLSEMGVQLETAVMPTTFYWGFNMLDETVGGYDESHRKLRQAISIALDIEEYIQIFLNGRGIAAQSPIPPGIFGYLPGEPGMNPEVYHMKDHHLERRPLEDAQKLLREAGYPKGINPKTQKPLILYLDATMGGGPDSQALYAWMRKQFEKLGIDLVVRATQYNRFQEKMRTGNAQIFSWGWNADYPDPENFLFLLYGPNSKVKHGGENAVNYENKTYDALFDKMKNTPNGEERQALIQQMLHIIQEDAPWAFGYHPKMYALSHGWVYPQKTSAMSRNTIKYMKVDPKLRAEKRKEWNKPIFWPVSLLVLLGFGICIPAWMKYRFKIHTPPQLKEKE